MASSSSEKRSMISHERIVPFVWPEDVPEEFDLTGLGSMALAGISLMTKNPIFAWISLMFSVTSLINYDQDRSSSTRQASSPYQGLMFSTLALTTSYIQKLIDPTVMTPSYGNSPTKN
ncbi:hypothetical protein CROQUDRAFT_659565 [Cronartium quercuum f. sp. fusiforme G11]|uniref:Uncharacterized protein n=1 Tax=Cronartium quercuum f. sp. fusiforme G11 TaxID=708437 RepID=A0A9P6NF17_9BASI|nr:hypothetical protein CROQUDRAFT_659565 [Cronartium quercuum f. sp. fusiforme G11]